MASQERTEHIDRFLSRLLRNRHMTYIEPRAPNGEEHTDQTQGEAFFRAMGRHDPRFRGVTFDNYLDTLDSLEVGDSPTLEELLRRGAFSTNVSRDPEAAAGGDNTPNMSRDPEVDAGQINTPNLRQNAESGSPETDFSAEFEDNIRRSFRRSARRNVRPLESVNQVPSSHTLYEANTSNMSNANGAPATSGHVDTAVNPPDEKKRLEESLADLLHEFTGITVDKGDAKQLLKHGVESVQMMDTEATAMKMSLPAQFIEDKLIASAKIKLDEYTAVNRNDKILRMLKAKEYEILSGLLLRSLQKEAYEGLAVAPPQNPHIPITTLVIPKYAMKAPEQEEIDIELEIKSINERDDLPADVKRRLETHIRLAEAYRPVTEAHEGAVLKDYEFFRALNNAFESNIPDLWNSAEAFLPKMWKFHQVKSNYFMKISKPYMDWHNDNGNMSKCFRIYKGQAIRADKLREVIAEDVKKANIRWNVKTQTANLSLEEAKVNIVAETHVMGAANGLLPDMQPVDWSQYTDCFVNDARHPWKIMPQWLRLSAQEEMEAAANKPNTMTLAEHMARIKPGLFEKYVDRIVDQVEEEEAAERPNEEAEQIEHRLGSGVDNHEARLFGQPTVEDATEEENMDNNINGGNSTYHIDSDTLTQNTSIVRPYASGPNGIIAPAGTTVEALVEGTLRRATEAESARPVRTRTRRAAPATPESSSPAPATPLSGSSSEYIPSPALGSNPVRGAGASRLRTSTSVDATDDDDEFEAATPAPSRARARANAAATTGLATPANAAPSRGRGPHYCNYPDCRTARGTYYRFGPRGDLNRHLRDVHFMSAEEARAHDCEPGEPDDL